MAIDKLRGIISFLFALLFVTIICIMAMIATTFAGTSYGAPHWFIAYLGVTQVLPVIVFFFSALTSASPNSKRETRATAGKVAAVSFLIYALSIAGMVFILK